MSATGKKRRHKDDRDDQPTIHINRRFHGHLLDVPDYVHIRKLKTNITRGRCPNKIIRFLKQAHQNDAPVFLFVPTKIIGRTLQGLLTKSNFDCAFVSAGNTDKRHLLRREHDITVTTTVLERGVTFTRLWVAVIMADHSVFDRDTLVQIAGRTGRKPEAPHGKVTFFAETLSVGMDKAIKTIGAVNRDLPHAL
jgi:competence protein ComFA